MAGAINISFAVAGKEDVLRAMQGISQTAAKLGRAGAQAAANEQKSADREVANVAKRAAKEVADAKKKAAREAASEARKLAKDTAKAEKDAKKEVADFQRELDRQGARNFKERVKEQIKLEKDAAKERARAVRAAESEASKSQNKAKQTVGDYGGGAARGFMSGAKTIAAVGAMATGGLGAATVVDAARAQLGLDERAAMLRNSSGLGKNEFDSVGRAKKISSTLGIDAGEVMGGFEKIAAKAGKSGLTEASSQLEALSKVARGAGVNMTDLGDVVATLVNRGVKAKDLVSTVEALVKQGQDGAVEFKDLATMLDASSGAMIKFEMSSDKKIMTAGGLSQFARTFGRASAAESTTSVTDLVNDLGNAADKIQELTGGEKTTVHTKGKKTTQMVDGKLVTTTTGDSTRTQYAGGVEVGTDSTRSRFRDLNELLPEIVGTAVERGTAGKLIGEGGFTGTSKAIMQPLIDAATSGIVKDGDRYRLKEKGENADLTGKEAARALLDQFNNATLAAGQSEKMLAEVMATDAGKISVATNKLKNDLGDKLAPVIAQLTPDIVRLGESFGNAVVAIAEHPKTAAASFLAFTTAMGVAEVGLGKLGSFVLDKLFSKATPLMNVQAGVVNVAGAPTPPVPPPGGPPAGAAGGAARGGVMGALSAAAAPVAAIAAIGAITAVAGGAGMDQGKKIDEGTRTTAADAFNEATKLRHGGGDRKKAQAQLEELERTQGVRGALGRLWEGTTAGARGLMNGEVSAANIARLSPTMALASGVGAMVNGGNAQGDSDAAIKALQDALKQPTSLAEGTTINIGNVDAIATAVNNNTQGPKANPPP